MILVTGATGKLGRGVVESLLRRGVPASEVIAGARNLDKAQSFAAQGVKVKKVDYNDPQTIEAALAGVDRVLLISGFEPNRVEQHRAVIEAAKRAGVALLAYTSGPHADTSKIRLIAEHRATEEILRQSCVPFVALRNSWYVENYTDNVGPALEHGVMFGAAGDGKVSVAPRSDYAEAAAVVLTTDGHQGKVYELGGDQAYTLSEIAKEISRIAGKPVAYKDLPEAEYAATLIKFGVPEVFAKLLADADSGLKRGELLVESGDLSRLLGRPATPLATALERALRS
jgi:NAD(P)H dehydrogenase (quinone)